MPFERIVALDVWSLAHNQHIDILKHGSVKVLACGHRLLTKAKNQARCPRCREMLDRSINTSREDYDSFRKGLVPDTMEWEGDTMRIFHEPRYLLECTKATINKDLADGRLTWDEAKKKLIEAENPHGSRE